MPEIRECTEPFDMLFVHADGAIKPCCYAQKALGHFRQGDDLVSVWSGPLLQELRSSIRANKLHDICVGAGCPFVASRMPEPMDESPLDEVETELLGFGIDRALILQARVGNPSTLCRVGALLYQAGGYPQAVSFYEKAAAMWEIHAMYLLASCLLYGTGCDIDLPRAIDLLGYASKEGVAEAHLSLSRLANEGRGMSKDPGMAAAYLRQAVELGNIDACYLYGKMLANGEGIERDEEKARSLIQRAARHGHQAAIELIETMKNSSSVSADNAPA